MGCCSSKNSESLPIKHPLVIDTPEEGVFRFVMPESQELKENIDEPMIVIDKISLNALGYALVTGRLNNFVLLLEGMGASIAAMEDMLERQGLVGIDILIERGYFELLCFYFPLYKAAFPQKFSNLEDSETSCSFPNNTRNSRKTPLHIATERGFLDIIEFVYYCFKDSYAPEKYNIHHIDEYTGENSALIACKKCHFQVVRLLREKCEADFSLKSKRSESALHLAVFGSKTNKSEGFELIKYLVEEVEIDITFQYEETLLILNDSNILDYIEKKLLGKGILCTKEEVEKKYCISSYKESRPRFLFDDSELTLGAISSIDANATLSLINGSFFQDSDYNIFIN